MILLKQKYGNKINAIVSNMNSCDGGSWAKNVAEDCAAGVQITDYRVRGLVQFSGNRHQTAIYDGEGNHVMTLQSPNTGGSCNFDDYPRQTGDAFLKARTEMTIAIIDQLLGGGDGGGTVTDAPTDPPTPPPATCTDGTKNQGETRVDCGGANCPACGPCQDDVSWTNADGNGCATYAQDTTLCLNPTLGPPAQTKCPDSCGACTATCSDGLLNNEEQATDCGGPNCDACITCSDGKMNGDEIGIDCGGSKCNACDSFQWHLTLWAPAVCPVACGGTGPLQTRTVTCKDQNGDTVENTLCEEALGHDASSEQTCNTQACPEYTWSQGSWGACNVACGDGMRFADVTCVSDAGGPPVADSLCKAADKPATEEACMTGVACDSPTWSFGAWGTCQADQCPAISGGGEVVVPGTRTRTVECKLAGSAATGCVEADKPASEKLCEQECHNYGWVACAYTQCTSPCGGASNLMGGMQTRQVFCRDESNDIVDNTFCEADTALYKPKTIKEGCNPQACTANYWMVSDWGPCVGGKMKRTKHCHLQDGANGEDADCDQDKMPLLEKACQNGECPAVLVGEVGEGTDPSADGGSDGGSSDSDGGTTDSGEKDLSAAGALSPSLLLLAALALFGLRA